MGDLNPVCSALLEASWHRSLPVTRRLQQVKTHDNCKTRCALLSRYMRGNPVLELGCGQRHLFSGFSQGKPRFVASPASFLFASFVKARCVWGWQVFSVLQTSLSTTGTLPFEWPAAWVRLPSEV